MADERAWHRVILPAYESTGGIAQTSYCLICGAAIVITQTDSDAAAIHIEWHTARRETLDDGPERRHCHECGAGFRVDVDNPPRVCPVCGCPVPARH